MTAAMTGFGLLLLLRHRLRRVEQPLAEVRQVAARQAGRAVLWVTASIALLVLGIVVRQAWGGGPLALLSLAMPVVALIWLAAIGLKAWRWPASVTEAVNASERPSRRPPDWERRTPPGPGPSSQDGAGRHVRA